MIKPLTAQEKAIIQQAILDRWNPHRLTWKIANHFDLSENQIRHIKSKATFKAECARQLAIYQGSFYEIQLGHRKERVKAMAVVGSRHRLMEQGEAANPPLRRSLSE